MSYLEIIVNSFEKFNIILIKTENDDIQTKN